jgi:hypothetical protein
MSILKTATCCWRQAAQAEIQAAQITDQHLKAIYLRIADQWSVLARSYEFADSAEQFLLDAKRTEEANSRQLCGELVHLPSSLAGREAEHLLKPHSDRCCGTMRLVAEGPASQPGTVAA